VGHSVSGASPHTVATAAVLPATMSKTIDEEAARKERVLAYMQQQASEELAEDSFEWSSDDSERALTRRLLLFPPFRLPPPASRLGSVLSAAQSQQALSAT